MILTPKQDEARDILNGPAKHVLLDGGSRSGKSVLIVRNLILRALKAKGSRHAILRFRFNHVKESIALDTFPKVMQMEFPHIPVNVNKSDWFATFPNQSEIWFGGLDDKERTEKILGKEYASIYLNECSQIPYSGRNIALTRLAQKCEWRIDDKIGELALKMYYDCNPPSKSHWVYQLFYQRRDPESKRPLQDFADYARCTLNPRDNEANLASSYIAELEKLPARMRKRFLEGSYGEVAPGQLWTDEILERWRSRSGEVPDLQRIVVAVDPSGSGDEDNAGNDEIGIMVGGIGIDGNAYLLEDLTVKAGPKTWGGIAAAAFDRHDADCIVGEKNYGGAMVGYVLDTQPRAGRRRPFKLVTASRGKAVRAEPISALHEQGKIRLVGNFNLLEEELCSMTTNGYMGQNSPNRADAFVWLMSELFPGLVKQEREKADVSREYQERGHAGFMAA